METLIEFATIFNLICTFPSHRRKGDIGAVGTRPPFLQLNRSRQSFGRCSLISYPINAGKWIRTLFIPPGLHDTDGEVVCVDTFCPWSNSVVDCHRVIQLHVIDGYLNMNLFIRIKSVWRKCDCLTVWIWPFWNLQQIYTAPYNWKTCFVINFNLKVLYKGTPLCSLSIIA